MCGGGGGFISDPIQTVSDAFASMDPGPAIGSGLSSLDSAVSQNVPGGWGTIGALAAAIITAGASIPASEAEFIAADAANLASQGLSQEAIAQNLAASYSISASDAAAAAAATNTGAAETFAQTGTLNPEFTTQQTTDPFAGLSSNAPVDTSLSQAAADTTSGLDYTAASPDFVGPTGTPDIPAADAAAQANQTAVSQSGNILGNTTDASGNITSTFDDGSTMTVDQSGNVVGTTEAPSTGGLPSSVTDVAKSLAKQAASKLLSTATSNLATGKGVLGLPLTSSGLGSYGANLTGDTTGGATAPNLTPDLTKGNIDFTLMGAPTTAAPQIYNVGTNPAAYAPIASTPQQTPGFAQGGEFEEEPQFYSVGGLESMNNHYVQGDGDGTSDSVNAKLADGEFVIPADVVAKLGNGSNNAGASVLDQFLTTIREHKQENGTKLEPDSKGPLAYLLDAKKKARA